MQTNNHASGSADGAVAAFNYSEAFPSLPDTGRSALPTTSPWASRPAASRPAVQSNTAVEKLVISYEERRLKTDGTLFGKEAESEKSVLVEIQKETHTTINMTQIKDGSIVLLISGKRDDVRKARNDAMRRLQTQANVVLNIPKEYHRFILGVKGQTKMDLETLTGAKIYVPRMEEARDDIRIVGPQEGLIVARDRILAIYDEQSKRGSERLNIPKIYHPLIQGPNNSVVEALRAKTGVSINIPPPSVQKDEISISGEKDAVAFVKNELLRLYQEIAQKTKEVTVEVPKEQHRYVQGRQGVNLHSILESTGVWVDLPPPDSDSNSVTLRGNPAKFGDALNIVFEKANSVVKVDVKAPNWIHKHMKGAGGDKVRALQQNYQVRINYEGDKVQLEGAPNEVDTVRKILEADAKELISTLAIQELKIDEKFMKHIIGKNGTNVSYLKSEYGVQIRSADATRPNILIVEGPKDSVAEAVKHLKERLAKMENERSRDIIIDRNLHKLIIGTRGQRIREIRDAFKETNVAFPDSEENSDIVTIRGPKEEVDKCFKYLEKLVKDLVLNNHRIEVPIFKEVHRSIIGKGGSTIRKIREETDTKIDLPAENSESDVIIITGKKENAENAKILIQKIQNELANSVEVKLSIPNKLHTHLIGAKGRTIQGIIQECGNVQIQMPLPGSNSDDITVRGPQADAEKARDLLQKIAHDRELSSYTVEVPAKQEYHRHFGIARLRDRFNVRIVVPAHSAEDRDFISIIGKKENVERAHVEIEKTIKDLQNTVDDSVTIPLKHHKRFTTRRGEVIENIIKEAGNVRVIFPREDDSDETIKLHGPRDAVDKAKASLLQRVADWDSEITIEVDIPAKYYGHVMGPKGQRVSHIQEDFDVHIKFPERKDGGGRNGSAAPKPAPAAVVTNGDSGSGDASTDHSGGAAAVAENGSEHSDTAAEVKKEVVTVTGRPEDVEAAKEALLALVPIDDDVDIPFEFHSGIIGKSGQNIRKLMDKYQVNISVPHPDKKSSIIRLFGLRSNVEEAKKGLKEEAESIAARSFQVEIRVDPKYHSKLIGNRGAQVIKLRQDFDVDVQFPRPNDPAEDADKIVFIGTEKQANAARDKVKAVIDQLESQVELSVPLDSRIHARIIGRQGMNLRKLMDTYKVDIRFPRRDEPDMDQVTITGDEANVYNAESELKRLEDLYLDDVAETEALRSYHAPSRNQEQHNNGPRTNGQGFVLQGAPWQASGDMQEFPSLAGPGSANNNNGGGISPVTSTVSSSGSPWGAPR